MEQMDYGASLNRQRLHAGDTAPSVLVNQGSGWTLYYHICRDYLGRITHPVNSNGTVAYKWQFVDIRWPRQSCWKIVKYIRNVEKFN